MGGGSEKMDVQMAPLMSKLQREFLDKMLQGVVQNVDQYPLGAGFPGYGPDAYTTMPFQYGKKDWSGWREGPDPDDDEKKDPANGDNGEDGNGDGEVTGVQTVPNPLPPDVNPVDYWSEKYGLFPWKELGYGEGGQGGIDRWATAKYPVPSNYPGVGAQGGPALMGANIASSGLSAPTSAFAPKSTPKPTLPTSTQGYSPSASVSSALGSMGAQKPLDWFGMLNQQNPMTKTSSFLPQMLTTPITDPWRYGLTGNYPKGV